MCLPETKNRHAWRFHLPAVDMKKAGLRKRSRLLMWRDLWSVSQSAQLAHLALQVVLQADFADQLDLGFQEVDVFLGIVQDALQQVT